MDFVVKIIIIVSDLLYSSNPMLHFCLIFVHLFVPQSGRVLSNRTHPASRGHLHWATNTGGNARTRADLQGLPPKKDPPLG